MTLPAQLIGLTIPSLIYLFVQKLRRKSWGEISSALGWQLSAPIHFLWGLFIFVLLGGLGWISFQFIPSEILNDANINISQYTGMTVSLASFLWILLREGLYVALGEEIFFRGFLGGWLVRRFGFPVGNSLQAIFFLVPHLLLLLISLSLWPILLVQLVAGWSFGWLRHRSGSILPGWLVHSLINALGAFAFL